MNKNDVIDSLLKVLSTRKEARDAFETIFGNIKGKLKNGEKVVISGFGSFHPITTKAKRLLNPKTGQAMNIAPHKKIRFKQSKEFFL